MLHPFAANGLEKAEGRRQKGVKREKRRCSLMKAAPGGRTSLPSAFCLPASAFRLLPSAFRLLPSAFRLLPSAFRLLPSAFCFLPSAFCLLPSAFCLLPSAFCLLPSAFCLLPSLAPHPSASVPLWFHQGADRLPRSDRSAGILPAGTPALRRVDGSCLDQEPSERTVSRSCPSRSRLRPRFRTGRWSSPSSPVRGGVAAVG
jgi:hypothetical protein